MIKKEIDCDKIIFKFNKYKRRIFLLHSQFIVVKIKTLKNSYSFIERIEDLI